MTRYFKLLRRSFYIILIALLACNDDEVIQKPVDLLVALAGEDQAVRVNEVVTLDGSASYAKDDKPFTLRWTIKSKPAGSLSTIVNRNLSKANLQPDLPGIYILQLMISRENQSATDELKVTVTEEGQQSPETILLNQDFMVATVLDDIFEDPSQPDYRVMKDILVRGDLTIAPGVVIEFEENTSLEIVDGTLKAAGSEEKEIFFKGVKSLPGFWKGIFIHTNSDKNELKYVTISDGGGKANTSVNVSANVILVGNDYSGGTLSITRSSLINSATYGLYVEGMSFLNAFSENSFADNNSAAAYIPAGQLHRIDVASFSDEVIETGGLVLNDQDLVWKNLAYRVTNDVSIEAGVTIEAGARLMFDEGTTLSVSGNGYLHASGHETAKITFTSLHNNKHWNGIYINSYNQNNIFRFSEISNAGAHPISDAEHEGNIYVGTNGLLHVSNSIIKNGKGYGIVAKNISGINANATGSNFFENLGKGKIYPLPSEELPPVKGLWLDQWSFIHDAAELADNFYKPGTQAWFDGAPNPWAMVKPGFGLHIAENGDFSWYIAEHSPMTGCVSYSAEYITGSANINQQTILFQQDHWRSKFVNECDESQNVDTEVTPIEIELPYTITKMHNQITGDQYWELKFTNADQSVFKFYRR